MERERTDDAYVLVSVLWLLIFVAGLAATISLIARQDLRTTAHDVSRVRLQLVADASVRFLAGRLAAGAPAPMAGSEPPKNGASMSCRTDDETTVVYAISDTAGLVDLNTAPRSQLYDLVRAGGGTQQKASALSAAILDYRDRDDVPERGGAERGDYKASGYPFGPKNAPFDTVSELDQVMGMTPELSRRLAPLATVHSRQPIADPSVAPAALKAIVAGQSGSQPLATGGAIRGRSFLIIAVATDTNGMGAARSAVMDLAPQDPRGLVFREWSNRMPYSDMTRNGPRARCPWF